MRTMLLFVLLLSSTLLQAQKEIIQEVNRLLTESRSKFPGMRPQAFFSQDKYAPGDTAYFRLFILTEDERILAERFLLTLELVSPQGSVVIKQNVSCVTFGAANQLILPETLAPGPYEVRLYSERMTMAYGLSTYLMVVGEKQMEALPRSGNSFGIFPEGGHVIAGGLNRLIVRAPGTVPVSASLYTDETKVMPVEFDKDGLASLHFVPLENHSYRIDYVVGDRSLTMPVPAAEPGAITLRVYAGPRKTSVLDMLAGEDAPRKATLLLIAHREIRYAQEVRFIDGRGSILAAADFFPDGFSELFVIDEELKILAYRPVYRQQKNPLSLTFSGIPDQSIIREEIVGSLKLTDSAGLPALGACAVSVVHENVRIHPVLTPDASLELHNIPFRGSLGKMTPDQVELELIGRQVPARLIPEYPPLLYNSNLHLSGRVYSTDPSTPLPYMSKIVIYLHKDLIQYETQLDGSGYFNFPKIYDFLGTDHVFFKVTHMNKDVPRVRVDWSVNTGDHEAQPATRYVQGVQPDDYGVLRMRRKAIDQSFGFFLGEGKSEKTEVNYNVALEDEFQNADVTIYPREYTPFETMQELILEVIPSLMFRARQKDSTVTVTLVTRSPFVAQRYAEGIPLYVIDGWMSSDTRYLMSLSPRDVISVKIINDIGKLDRLGNLARNGVVFIQTTIPETTRRDLGSRLHVLEGFSPTQFYTDHYSLQKRVPDLRTLLFWNPQLGTDSTGNVNIKFRTSDIPGKYWVRVMGTTASGYVVTAEKSFEVKFK